MNRYGLFISVKILLLISADNSAKNTIKLTTPTIVINDKKNTLGSIEKQQNLICRFLMFENNNDL